MDRIRLRWRALFAAVAILSFAGAPAPLMFAGRNASLFATRDGALHVIYLDPDSSRVAIRDVAPSLSPATFISPDAAEARGENGPALTELADGTLFAVYTSAKQLRAQISRDGGRTWSAPSTINDDREQRSHQFADVTPNRNGEAVVAWLDNRAGQQGVQTALVGPNGVAARTQTADPKTCQCCRTALFTASNGAIFLAYRDLAEGKIRNIAYSVSRDGGKTFRVPRDVADDHWSVDGCPESGPRFIETRDGVVHVAWMTGAAGAIELASFDGDAFTKPRVVARSRGVNHPELGLLSDGRLAVFYETAAGEARSIEMRAGDAKPVVVASSGSFPRYARGHLAYTTYVDGKPRVVIAEVSR